MRTAPEVTLPVHLDRTLPGPLPRQLAAELRRLIGEGVVRPGEALPSTRALAERLTVSRGTVVAAYDQLLAEGYLAASTGGSTRVNPGLAEVHPRMARAPRPSPSAGPPVARVGSVPVPTIDLRPGRPSEDRIVTPAWRTAWREAAARPFDPDHDDLGAFALRREIASHLRRMRAVVREPEQVVVTSGGREGLTLLLHALAGGHRDGFRNAVRGHAEATADPAAAVAIPVTPAPVPAPSRSVVGVEDPGYPSLRRVPERLGWDVVPLAADEHGLVVDALPTGDAPELVIVTPSHQYPLGGSLPVDRRLGLLAWARRHRAWVVEDDYDSELRYTSQPLPALAALDDPDDPRVVTLGTFSTTLSPGLGAGYLLLPDPLVESVRAVRADLGQPVSLVVQQALAAYLARGDLRRHTQRMRHLYRRRRARVVEAFAGVAGVRVSPMDGGLHAVVETRREEAEVLAAARARGVLVAALSAYWAGGSARPSGRQGIVFGFGAVSDQDLNRGLAVLREVC